ncbi:MAG: nucleoside triphosphate pyrophosphatase [Rickettsiales bacterium]|nr:nucleoside triphosphate pyrophosphatase [Rickettsiales bacterium]
MKLILASSSPRRKELLGNIGFTPDEIISPDIDETPRKAEKPNLYVARVAEEKAKAIYENHKNKNAFILSCDTSACVGTRILGKPENELEAKKMLQLMRGRRHRVYSCVCVITPEGKIRKKVVLSFVKFKNFTDSEIDEYLKTNLWKGRSGAYSLQEDPGAWVISINGSYSNIVGLPLYETKNLLVGNGYSKAKVDFNKFL